MNRLRQDRSGLIELRDRFTLSQQDMADYLTITRSLLSMVETGARVLPVEALHRLATLERFYHSTSEARGSLRFTPDAEMQKKDAKSAQALAVRCNQCRTVAQRLQKKLEAMQQGFKNILGWQYMMEEMMNNLPASRQGEGDRLWLEIQQRAIPAKLSRYAPAVQAKLQAEIELLHAEADIKERLQKRLAGRPV